MSPKPKSSCTPTRLRPGRLKSSASSAASSCFGPMASVRKSVMILVLALVWEIYGSRLDNPLLFPTLTDDT